MPEFADSELVPASEDASFRRYFRIQSGEHTRIAMDAPPPQEDCGPFVRVAGYLTEIGLNAPRVFDADIKRGYLLLSDMGQQLYLNELSARPEAADALYRDAIKALSTLQREGSKLARSLPEFDEPMLRFEMSLFHDWLCERHLGLTFSVADEKQWTECCDVLVGSALAQPAVFVHRDYHSRNLMLTEHDNPGILDFQDAVIGPFTYDLVSLLKDCYVRWPHERVRGWALQFYAALDGDISDSISEDSFLNFFDLMGVQRHLKASGIFARLLHRDGKSTYMDDVPRTLQYIVEVGRRFPKIRFLADLIEQRCLPGLLANQ